MNSIKKRTIVLLSPFIIILITYLIAHVFGKLMGKWAFIPIILSMWILSSLFIIKYEEKGVIKKWLKKAKSPVGWTILSILVALIPLPIFLQHYHYLAPWHIWLPWILIALINPWIEEFYWRGLLITYTKEWSPWQTILFTSTVFSLYHIVFGVNSELNSGYTLLIVTFVLGIVWSTLVKKTRSLKWVIFAHFLVDLLSLSSVAFLDLFTTKW